MSFSVLLVFYGITLGLLAVAAWQTYSDVETRVGQEAAAIGALYRDVSSFPDPDRTELQSDLCQYTRQVIDVAGPANLYACRVRSSFPRSDQCQSGTVSNHVYETDAGRKMMPRL